MPRDELLDELEHEMVGDSPVAGIAFDATHGTLVAALENGRIFRLASEGDEGVPWHRWRWEEHEPVPGSRTARFLRRHRSDDGSTPPDLRPV